jgi:hypothetical protein
MFAIHQHWERARHLRFAPTAIYGMNFEKWYDFIHKLAIALKEANETQY